MTTECQSCFTDVIPMANGCCPSCGELLSGRPDGHFAKVTVRQNDPPAGICLRCGTPTKEPFRVRKKCRNSNYQPAESSVSQHPLAVVLDFIAGKYSQSVAVTVPLCSACRKAGVLEPKYVYFEAKSMTFVGHKLWGDEVLRLRKKAQHA
jgi:hypothetical protein